MADATRALPGNRHDEPSSPSPEPISVAILVTTLVGHFWKADPGHSPKAPKVLTHISHVVGAGRQQETRVIKLWRNQKNIDFPSFYLELVVIRALSGWNAMSTSLDSRVQTVFEYLRDHFPDARFVDPANTNNVVSDDQI